MVAFLRQSGWSTFHPFSDIKSSHSTSGEMLQRSSKGLWEMYKEEKLHPSPPGASRLVQVTSFVCRNSSCPDFLQNITQNLSPAGSLASPLIILSCLTLFPTRLRASPFTQPKAEVLISGFQCAQSNRFVSIMRTGFGFSFLSVLPQE